MGTTQAVSKSPKPPKPPEISRDEIRAVYAQGEEAVIGLVEGLLQRIAVLEARVEALENQQSKNSHNSSKPPSSDGFGRRTKSLRSQSGRPSGGQNGHPGSTLEWVEWVDEVKVHAPEECQSCGISLQDVDVVERDVRQVHDLEPMRLQVIEHQVEVKCCPQCQTLNHGVFPADVNSAVQYGAGIKGLMVYLSEYQLLPSERICQLLSDVFDCSVSEGTLYNSRERCFEQLEMVEAAMMEGMQQAGVGHFDETGVHINGKLWWLHVASTEILTYYFIHPKRGKVAMEAMEVLPQFEGISVHDGWSSYAQYDCDHALCNAHHLRELCFISERYQQPWAEDMITLLLEIKHQVEQAQVQGDSTLSPKAVQQFESRYQALIVTGLALNPPLVPLPDAPKSRGRPKQSPAKNLLARLHQHQAQVLAFMHDFRVPFDNNQAERDLRMMKLKQKISGGFRSAAGAQMFCRIRGYLSTLTKQGLNVLDALRQVFMQNPVLPTFHPE